MPQGLQVFDPSGRIVLDTNKITNKFLGRSTYTSVQNLNFYVPKHPLERPFIICYNFSNFPITLSKYDNGDTANFQVAMTNTTGFQGSFVIIWGVR